MCYTSPPRLLGRFAASGVRARRQDGARRNSDVVPRRLDGVQAQPRRPLSTASATTSLGELHLPLLYFGYYMGHGQGYDDQLSLI